MQQIIYIHIGTPKTGSSYLQNFFHENPDWLKAHKIYFCTPRHDTGFHNNADLAICCNDTNTEDASKEIFEDKKQVIQHYKKEFDKAKNFKTLLSAENFYDQPNVNFFCSTDAYWTAKELFYKNLKSILPEQADVQIIIYLRPQDEWIESWFNNSIRNRNRLQCDMAQLIQEQSPLMDYKKQIEILGNVFGAKSLNIKTYTTQKQTQHNDIVEKFLETLGVTSPAPRVIAKPSAENKRTPRELLDIQHILNRTEINAVLRATIEKGLRHYAGIYKSDSDHIYLSPEQRQELRAIYSLDNQAICQTYRLTEQLEIATPKTSTYKGLQAECMADFFIWLMSQEKPRRTPLKNILRAILKIK